MTELVSMSESGRRTRERHNSHLRISTLYSGVIRMLLIQFSLSLTFYHILLFTIILSFSGGTTTEESVMLRPTEGKNLFTVVQNNRLNEIPQVTIPN